MERKMERIAVMVLAGALLCGCGTTMGDRGLSGAGIGAGIGLIGGPPGRNCGRCGGRRGGHGQQPAQDRSRTTVLAGINPNLPRLFMFAPFAAYAGGRDAR